MRRSARVMRLAVGVLVLAACADDGDSPSGGTGSGSASETSAEAGPSTAASMSMSGAESAETADTGVPGACCDWLPACDPPADQVGCSQPCCTDGVPYICEGCDEGCEPEHLPRTCMDCEMLWAAHLVRLKEIAMCEAGDPCAVDESLYDNCGCALVVNTANTAVIESMNRVIEALEAAGCEPNACGAPCVDSSVATTCIEEAVSPFCAPDPG